MAQRASSCCCCDLRSGVMLFAVLEFFSGLTGLFWTDSSLIVAVSVAQILFAITGFVGSTRYSPRLCIMFASWMVVSMILDVISRGLYVSQRDEHCGDLWDDFSDGEKDRYNSESDFMESCKQSVLAFTVVSIIILIFVRTFAVYIVYSFVLFIREGETSLGLPGSGLPGSAVMMQRLPPQQQYVYGQQVRPVPVAPVRQGPSIQQQQQQQEPPPPRYEAMSSGGNPAWQGQAHRLDGTSCGNHNNHNPNATYAV
ncbi:MAG: hypothetical protein MHM6MM_002205 [Cercozoa sp. M6MM]